MNIPTPARLGGINIRMRIHPNNRNLPPEPLTNRFRRTAYTTDGDTVVTAERQNQTALGGVVVDLVGDATGDGGDGAGVFHAAIGRVLPRGGDEVGVEVDGVVAVEFVVEFVAELGEEACFDEGGGSSVNAFFALRRQTVVLAGQK